MNQLRRFRDTHLLSPFHNILLSTPSSERIGTTSQNLNPTPLNPVMIETVTTSFDDHEEVIFTEASGSVSLIPPRTDVQDEDPPPTPDPLLPPSPLSSPPATITANIISEQPIVSGTSSDALLVLSRASRDSNGNRPTIVVVAATPSTHSREPTGSIAGSIERQVERQNQ